MSRARFGVLAFGDSLTQGWHHHGLKKHPYALKLQELVDAAFGEKTFGIVALGVPGETTPEMVGRLEGLLKNDSFSHVIVMGGTNDLGRYSAEEIIKNLSTLYQQVIAVKSTLIALTIPTSEHNIKEITTKRTEINNWIRNEERPAVVVDIETLIAYNDDNEELWDDGLHFTSKGYNRIGELVFEAVKQIFQEHIEKQAVQQGSCLLH